MQKAEDIYFKRTEANSLKERNAIAAYIRKDPLLKYIF
jgi:hypothetical protein